MMNQPEAPRQAPSLLSALTGAGSALFAPVTGMDPVASAQAERSRMAMEQAKMAQTDRAQQALERYRLQELQARIAERKMAQARVDLDALNTMLKSDSPDVRAWAAPQFADQFKTVTGRELPKDVIGNLATRKVDDKTITQIDQMILGKNPPGYIASTLGIPEATVQAHMQSLQIPEYRKARGLPDLNLAETQARENETKKVQATLDKLGVAHAGDLTSRLLSEAQTLGKPIYALDEADQQAALGRARLAVESTKAKEEARKAEEKHRWALALEAVRQKGRIAMEDLKDAHRIAMLEKRAGMPRPVTLAQKQKLVGSINGLRYKVRQLDDLQKALDYNASLGIIPLSDLPTDRAAAGTAWLGLMKRPEAERREYAKNAQAIQRFGTAQLVGSELAAGMTGSALRVKSMVEAEASGAPKIPKAFWDQWIIGTRQLYEDQIKSLEELSRESTAPKAGPLAPAAPVAPAMAPPVPGAVRVK